ncbi:hypothetical protein C8J56DRAFT_211671 [Mycena floridula]|nr:hypothetical protein C8J56DRAFT_905206 [Mycena floridula]KAJ7583524.1 hypothetical protein C8J56DRAFT_211671 [Mycena floridula]
MVKLLQISALFLTLASFAIAAPMQDISVRSLTPVEDSMQLAARDTLSAGDNELTLRSEEFMDIESRSDSESMELERRISKALHNSNEKAKHAFQKIGNFVKNVL